MEDFVETLLDFNAELEDTDYKMPQTVLTNNFMNVMMLVYIRCGLCNPKYTL